MLVNRQSLNINLTVLGHDITFRPGADMERARQAADLLEKKFADQKMRSQGGQTKDILLTFLALGLADDLLQMKKQQSRINTHIQALIEKIEKSL